MENIVSINRDKLESLLQERCWTMQKLSARSEISYSLIRAIIAGRQSRIRKGTMCRIADALETQPANLI